MLRWFRANWITPADTPKRIKSCSFWPRQPACLIPLPALLHGTGYSGPKRGRTWWDNWRKVQQMVLSASNNSAGSGRNESQASRNASSRMTNNVSRMTDNGRCSHMFSRVGGSVNNSRMSGYHGRSNKVSRNTSQFSLAGLPDVDWKPKFNWRFNEWYL